MGIFQINHNVSSLNVQRHLNNTALGLSKSIEKLSSGLRINSGWDAPADLVISEQLRSQIGGVTAAIRNAQETLNYLATGEGALNEISTLLSSLQARAVHAANTGLVSSAQIAADQQEVDKALDAISRIVSSTRFAGKTVFTATVQRFHIGEGNSTTLDEVTFSTTKPNTSATAATVGGLSLDAIRGGAACCLSGHANSAMTKINAAITKIANLRGKFGSFMKGILQSDINSLSVTKENLTATESYVRDTNMAEEISTYTKQQIMVQAGMSVLAQANVASQSVLQLLG